ncbi:DndE family protein [Chloroflexota bacterium]
MLKSIKTSESNRLIVSELTSKLGMGPENIIARIAFAYSIAQEQKFNLNDIKDSKGKEYSSKVLFGDYLDFYIAVVSQYYGLHKSDFDIPKYIKMHIDDGLESIKAITLENPNLPLLDFIIEQIENGLEVLK